MYYSPFGNNSMPQQTFFNYNISQVPGYNPSRQITSSPKDLCNQSGFFCNSYFPSIFNDSLERNGQLYNNFQTLQTKSAEIPLSSPRAIKKSLNSFIFSETQVNQVQSINLNDTTRPNYGPSNNTDRVLSIRSSRQPNQARSDNRNLPVRSQNIDLSVFLNLKRGEDSFQNRSTCSSLSPGSSCFSNKSSSDFQCGGKSTSIECNFCRNNGEKEAIYLSHTMKDSLGKVTCPILRNFKCPKCGESGDYAHTNKYCPVTQRRKKEKKIKKLSVNS